MKRGVRAAALACLMLMAACSQMQEGRLTARSEQVQAPSARRAAARPVKRAPPPKPAGKPDAKPVEQAAAWTRLHCADGRRFAIRPRRAGAEVRVDDNPTSASFARLSGAGGQHFGQLPGYSLHQENGSWSYLDGGTVPPRGVACRKE